jgi:hypothetical protein
MNLQFLVRCWVTELAKSTSQQHQRNCQCLAWNSRGIRSLGTLASADLCSRRHIQQIPQLRVAETLKDHIRLFHWATIVTRT